MTANPFVGLRPFEKRDAHLFFGRDVQIDRLLAQLRSERFVAVLGASGSGKSSLVRAGLLPALEGAGSSWRIAVFRPGANPIRNLACAVPHAYPRDLRGTAVDQVAMVEAILRRGALGLADSFQEAGARSGDRIMLVVDQFEELFTFRSVAASIGADDDTAAFVKLLLAAERSAEVAIHIVLTMRAEYLGSCAVFHDLPEAISNGLFLIPRLNRDQLTAAIAGPVAVAGARIAPSLVQRLLNDVGDDPDQLPVLQHALMRVWERANGEQLGLDHYEAVGSLKQALSNHADEAYLSLDQRQQRIAESIFKSLTERTRENVDLRRPTTVGELALVAGATAEETTKVIDVFRIEGRSFLTPPANVVLKDDKVIDISHESLIRQWKRLRDWVAEEAADCKQYRQIDEDAARSAQQRASLWRGPALTAALAWRDRFRPSEYWARRYQGNFKQAMRFLDLSRLRRWLLRGGVAAAIAAFAGLLLVVRLQLDAQARADVKNRADADLAQAQFDQRQAIQEAARLKTANDALLNQKRADEAQLELTKKLASETSARQRETDRADTLRENNVSMRAQNVARTNSTGKEVAALALLHVLRRSSRPGGPAGTAEITKNLREYLSQLAPVRWTASLGRPVNAFIPGADTRLIVIGDDGPKETRAQAWSVTGKSETLPGLKIDEDAYPLVGSANTRRLAWSIKEFVHLWDAEAGPLESIKEPFVAEITSMALSPDGRYLLAASDHGVKLWDLDQRSGTQVFAGPSTAIAFGPDATMFAAATGGSQSGVRLWDTATRRSLVEITLPDGSGTDHVSFSPKGRYLAAAAGTLLHVWRLDKTTDGTLSAVSLGPNEPVHSQPMKAVAFSPDEQLIATASGDGTALVLRLTGEPPISGRSLASIKHDREVNAIAFAADSRAIITGSSDGTARVWRGTRWPEVMRVGHPDSVLAVTFLTDNTIATGASDGTVKVSEIPTASSAPVASRSSANTRGAPADVIETACSRLSRNLTADEWIEFFATDTYVAACPNRPVDPVEILKLQKKHALNGNAGPAREAFHQFKQLKIATGLPLEEVLEAARAQASVRNEAEASELFALIPRLAVSLDDPFEFIALANDLARRGRNAEAGAILSRAAKYAAQKLDDPFDMADFAVEFIAAGGRRSDVTEMLDRAVILALADKGANRLNLAKLLAQAGRRSEASKLFAEASRVALATATPNPDNNNAICWDGALFDFPVEVLASCEAAVANVKPGDNRNLAEHRDSRGVAYALIGKADLALADFEAFVKVYPPSSENGKIRDGWIRDLRQGRNPFSAANKEKTLAALRR